MCNRVSKRQVQIQDKVNINNMKSVRKIKVIIDLIFKHN